MRGDCQKTALKASLSVAQKLARAAVSGPSSKKMFRQQAGMLSGSGHLTLTGHGQCSVMIKMSCCLSRDLSRNGEKIESLSRLLGFSAFLDNSPTWHGPCFTKTTRAGSEAMGFREGQRRASRTK
jgi:hypothetical protein